ncbi:MAG: viroplasmin family protein [Saprospiraceae bacterium]
MAKRKQKFYVVWKGAKPGVYNSWPEANAQVAGFPGAKFKSFTSRTFAMHAFKIGPSAAADSNPKTKSAGLAPNSASIIKPSLSVDAACSGNPGKMEYQGVSTATKDRIFHQAFPLGTNNIGEFLALIHGIAFCKSEGLHDMPIYTDSRIAMGWVSKKKCKTTLPRNAKTEKLYMLIDRGEAWLKTNTFKNPILKWETKKWGEIPADFGRK